MTKKLIHEKQDDRGRLRCDNKRCLHVLTECLPWGTDLIGYKCPECGDSMLTNDQYELSNKVVRTLKWINRWFGWMGTEQPPERLFSVKQDRLNITVSTVMTTKTLAENCSDEVIHEFLKDTIGFVEATSFEHSCLWREYHQEMKKTWVQRCDGLLIKLGTCDLMPVMLSLRSDVVDGHKIVFYECTSQVADFRMVDEFLVRAAPWTAMRPHAPDRVNTTNASNFCNIFPRKVDDEPI